MSRFPWHKYALNPDIQQSIALQDEQGNLISWTELATWINIYVATLQQQGVKGNSGVAICGKNSLVLLLAYLATIQLGARVLPLNPAFTDDKITQLCLENQIQYVICLESRYFSQELTALCVPSGISSIMQQKLPVGFKQVLKNVDLLRPATMTLTSGSSGKAKAVVHHIQAHLDNAFGVCQLMNFTAQDSWLLSLPLYHVSGQGIIWRWLAVGATLHLPTQDLYLSLSKASHVSLVPTQLQRFLAYWQQNPSLSVATKHILLGGSQIPLPLTQALQQKGIQSYSGYGMTEMASTVFAKKSDERQGVGKPLIGREFLLVEQEIWLRGAGLAMGYWHNGDIVSLLNQEGWLQTKDKGCWQNDELLIIGRLDNMFISGGENIQPEEIEQLLLTCETVEQVFVLPVVDPEFGHRPVAMIKFKPQYLSSCINENATENNEKDMKSAVENLRNWLKDKLERFKQPIAYFPLPSTSEQENNIKISRHQLKIELDKLIQNQSEFVDVSNK